MFEVIDDNSQNRVKDCFAPCPKIDLVLRCNGEQPVEVITALNQRIPGAGIEANVSIPPNPTTTGAPGVFPADKIWAYKFVYAAETWFPLVENERTGGGSLAPRGNPNIHGLYNEAISNAGNTHARKLLLPCSQEPWVSHIWVYRTDLFDFPSQTGLYGASANGNLLFWIGKVANNPNLVEVPFTDTGPTLMPLKEQIEADNFKAPQFKRAVYANNYFWGFCNDDFVANVAITITGLVTLTSPNDQWYIEGRDGQIATLDGITSNGFDKNGTFYFKATGDKTGQLYLDLTLTQVASLPANGNTRIRLRGRTSRLYRSKINNPLSWGDTDLIGTAQVPAPWFFDLGGGTGRAIAEIPNLGMLKLDLEAPNQTFIMNLKNAGTPNFQASLRSLAQNYCVSIPETQFSATLDKGQNVLWAADTKSVNLVECDGGSQRPISSKAFRSLRGMIIDGISEKMYHANYSQRMELNCFFFRNQPTGSEGTLFPFNNKMVFQHAPTGYWGTMDTYDLTCSCEMVDNGIIRLMVGNTQGFIGEMFAQDQFSMWFAPFQSGNGFNSGFGPEFFYVAGGGTPNVLISSGPTFRNNVGNLVPGVVGNWLTVIRTNTDTNESRIYICRITGTTEDGMPHNGVTVEKTLQVLQNGTLDIVDLPEFNITNYPGNWTGQWFIGLIESVAGRTFTGGQPQNNKEIQEFWSTWMYPTPFTINPPSVEFQFGYVDNYGGQQQFNLTEKSLGTANPEVANLINSLKPRIFGRTEKVPIDMAKVFGIIVRDRNYIASRILNYDVQLTLADNG